MFFGQKNMRPTAATVKRTRCSNRAEHQETTTATKFLQQPLDAFEKTVLVCTFIGVAVVAWIALHAATNAAFWFIANVLGNPCGWAV